jgi:hypothetical protein
MEYQKVKPKNGHTITAAAKIAGINPRHLWALIYQWEKLPAPTMQAGHRKYYDHIGVVTLLNRIQELRETKQIRC